MKKLIVFSLLAFLVISAAIGIAVQTATPVLASDTSCGGQIWIHNNSSYVVQLIAINNPKEHLDVPPGMTYQGHISYNQPKGVAKDVPGVGEVKLGKFMVDWRCEFDGGDAHVWVTNNSFTYTLPQGFDTSW